MEVMLSYPPSAVTPLFRCDNQATTAMLENPSWRSRHVSIRGERIREEVKAGSILLTYVQSSLQLADPYTKATPPAINDKLYPLMGLVPVSSGDEVLPSSEPQSSSPGSKTSQNSPKNASKASPNKK